MSLVEDKILSDFYTKFGFKDLTVEKLYIGKRELGECPMCGDKLIRDTRQVDFKRKNDTNVMITLSGEYCDNCGESFHTDDDLKCLQDKLKGLK
jgi:YgiT-type zinc finger domain-containing protein